MPYNRALFCPRAALVADTPGVSAGYAAALGASPVILDALLGQVVAHVTGENGRLDLEPVGLHALRQTVLLESGVTGSDSFKIAELRDLCRVL